MTIFSKINELKCTITILAQQQKIAHFSVTYPRGKNNMANSMRKYEAEMWDMIKSHRAILPHEKNFLYWCEWLFKLVFFVLETFSFFFVIFFNTSLGHTFCFRVSFGTVSALWQKLQTRENYIFLISGDTAVSLAKYFFILIETQEILRNFIIYLFSLMFLNKFTSLITLKLHLTTVN